MASRFQFAKNRANDLAIEIGGVLAPIITDLVDRLEPLIARVSEFVQEANPGAIKWLAGLAAALVAIGGGLIAYWCRNEGGVAIAGARAGHRRTDKRRCADRDWGRFCLSSAHWLAAQY